MALMLHRSQLQLFTTPHFYWLNIGESSTLGKNALLMFTLGLIFLDQSAKAASYALYYVNEVTDYFL